MLIRLEMAITMIYGEEVLSINAQEIISMDVQDSLMETTTLIQL